MTAKITCEDFRERLEATASTSTARPGAELAEHAAACGSEACRREWDDAQLLLHVARSLDRPVSMRTSVERALADLAPTAGGRRCRCPRRLAAEVAADRRDGPGLRHRRGGS